MTRSKLTYKSASLFFFLSAAAVTAHDLPLSYLDLRLSPTGIEATLETSAKRFAREHPAIDEAQLLAGSGAAQGQLKEQIATSLATSLTITSKGVPLAISQRALELLPAQGNLRLRFKLPGYPRGSPLEIACQLFASDARHRTFLNIYEQDTLRYQGIFDRDVTRIEYQPGGQQSTLTVVRQFLYVGIHHIFIGPDHILFLVGLLLLGGSVSQLLKVITAFTIAHSVTLVLATLNLLSPPPRLIEPAIALSIVFVGAHALLADRSSRDWRLLFAFCFGFIHGFGFASVLREMDLPRAALGWSLFSFNAGVEIAQACIVLAVAPLLALAYRRSSRTAGGLVTAASFVVVFAGSYWFVDRLFPAA